MKVPTAALLILGALGLIVGTAAIVLAFGPNSANTAGIPPNSALPSSDAWQSAERNLQSALAVATRDLSEMWQADEDVKEYDRQGFGLLFDRILIGGETLDGTEAQEANLYMLADGGRSLAVSIAGDALEKLRVALAEGQSLGVHGAVLKNAEDVLRRGTLDVVELREAQKISSPNDTGEKTRTRLTEERGESTELNTSNLSAEISVGQAQRSEYELIEQHRDLQLSKRDRSGLYPSSVLLKYKKLAEQNPESRAFTYLYARVCRDREHALRLAKDLVERWPEFAYGHRLFAHQLVSMAGPIDMSTALRHAQLEEDLALPDAHSGLLAQLQKVMLADEQARKATFTVASKLDSDHEFKRYVPKRLGPTAFRLTLQKKKGTPGRLTWQAVGSTTVSFEYLGIVRAEYDQPNLSSVLALHYQLTVQPPGSSAKVLFVCPNSNSVQPLAEHISADSLRAGDGRASLLILPEAVSGLREARLIWLYTE